MSDRPATLLPPGASALARAIETVKAEPVSGLEQPLSTLWNADTCPTHLLPWLAWAFSVDVWESDWPGTVKREVIRRSIEVHRLKGTRRAVEIALDALGVRIDLAEWFEYGGAPHTFRLDAFGENVFDAGFGLDVDFYRLVLRQVEAVKPVRAQVTLRIGERFSAAAFQRSGSRQARRSRITHTPGTRGYEMAVGAVLSTAQRQRARLEMAHTPGTRDHVTAVTAGPATGLRQGRAHRAASETALRIHTALSHPDLRTGLRVTRVDRFTHDIQRSA